MPGKRNKRGMRVLIVEDDEDNLDFLRTVVEADGHVCRTARTVAEAVAAIDAGAPDVILLDFFLPDGYGMEVARHAREKKRVRVVAVSAYLERWSKDAYAQLGIKQLIPKPYRVQAIRKALRGA